MSTHEVPVVLVTARKHPNADTLGIVNVYGYQSCVQLKEFPLGMPTKAVFIPPDYVVPSTDDWAFLKGHNRITTRKFRGERSEGIVLPCPNPKWAVGYDAMLDMGITRWVSPSELEEMKKQGRKMRRKLPWWNWRRYYWAWQNWRIKRENHRCKPPYNAPKYDLEPLKRYPVLKPDEVVVVTEKIHGCNARYTFAGGRLYVGSHTLWKNPNQTSWWVDCAKQNPWIEALCRRNPGVVFYGEIYGASIQPLEYGIPKGRYAFRMFDIREAHGEWASWDRLESFWFTDPVVKMNWVPEICKGFWGTMDVEQLVTGKTKLGGKHIREGVVIEPWIPRTEPGLGRVKLKAVSPEYLEVNHEGQKQYLKEHTNG